MLKRLPLFFLAPCSLPAMASDHGALDPMVHLKIYAENAFFWLKQGEIEAAFNQPLCFAGDSPAVRLTHFVFAEGGGLWIGGLAILASVLALALHIEPGVRRSGEYTYA